MKTQFEKAVEIAEIAKDFLQHNFSTNNLKNDPRLNEVLRLVSQIPNIKPWFSTSGLVIEFDTESGRPTVNREMAQRHIDRIVEKALAEAEPNIELDLLDSSRDDVLIDRLNGAPFTSGVPNPREARFMLTVRLEMYQEAERKIIAALAGKP